MTDYGRSQSAYTKDELVDFLAEVYDRLPDNVSKATVEVLAAVRAAVAEYGLNANYVTQKLGTRGTKTVLDRNYTALDARAKELKAKKEA